MRVRHRIARRAQRVRRIASAAPSSQHASGASAPCRPPRLLCRRRSAYSRTAETSLDPRRRIAGHPMSTCQVCELHAESTFKVEGMDCHEEVAILERRLKRLAGLEALDADVIGQRLRIKYDAAKLSTGSIAEAVAQTGMRAWLEHEEPLPVAASADRRLQLLAGSGIAFAIGLLGSFLQTPASFVWIPFAVSIALGGVFTARRAVVSVRA